MILPALFPNLTENLLLRVKRKLQGHVVRIKIGDDQSRWIQRQSHLSKYIKQL